VKYLKSILVGFALCALLDIVLDMMIPDRVMNVIFVITASVLLIGILLVVYGTLVQNGWGINLKPVTCPSCNCAMPQVRKPKSLREALWGGGTCMNCGCEMDKWGRQITPSR
jgi:hypothetical protein